MRLTNSAVDKWARLCREVGLFVSGLKYFQERKKIAKCLQSRGLEVEEAFPTILSTWKWNLSAGLPQGWVQTPLLKPYLVDWCCAVAGFYYYVNLKGLMLTHLKLKSGHAHSHLNLPVLVSSSATRSAWGFLPSPNVRGMLWAPRRVGWLSLWLSSDSSVVCSLENGQIMIKIINKASPPPPPKPYI